MRERVFSRIPSARALKAAFGPEVGAKLRALLDGSADPEIAVPATGAWAHACYHPPRAAELVEHACNVVMGGHGCEAIRASNGRCGAYYGDIVAGYVNMGDTYDVTLLFDYGRGAVYVTSWGDWVEVSERTRRYRFE